jgi:hypothetical protein
MSEDDAFKKTTSPGRGTSPDGDSEKDRGAGPSLNRAVQAQLGQRLRHFYEALALGEQPVPDRFIEIINRLDQTLLNQGHPEKPQ